MPSLKKLIILFIVLMAFCLDGAGSGSLMIATYSIIIIDPRTKEIGIAGASCTYSCYGIGGIIPGKGAIIVQAMSNKEAKAKGLEMIGSGQAPEQIIAAITSAEFHPERQQYAVVSARHIDRPLTYTGDLTYPYTGAMTANGMAVQGNTLTNPHTIQTVFEAVLEAQKEGLSVHAMLMLALKAGVWTGGDKRCEEQKATTAFITVAGPDDPPERPYLDLGISGQPEGGANAVDVLQNKYDEWSAEQRSKQK